MEAVVDALNEMADIIEGIDDEETAQAASEKLKGVVERLKSRAEKWKEDPIALSPEEKDDLLKKYQPEMVKALMRLMVTAAAKSALVPETKQVMEDVERAMAVFQ